VMREYGFTPEHVFETAKAVLKRTADEVHDWRAGDSTRPAKP